MSTASSAALQPEHAFALCLASNRDADASPEEAASRVVVHDFLRLVQARDDVLDGPETPSSPRSPASELGAGPELPTPSASSASAPQAAQAKARRRSRSALGALPSPGDSRTPQHRTPHAPPARPLLHVTTNLALPIAPAPDHDVDLPSLETLDVLPPAALPGVVADLAARQAYLAALQARAAARLSAAPTVTPSGYGIAPGQRLSAQQLADRLGRSLDYVYRHADDWPFTVREGRSVKFDEAGFVRWQHKRMSANGARRREVP